MACVNYVETVVEEIALEGLEGITLPSLWLRLEDRKDVQFAVQNKERVQTFFWQAMVSHNDLTFFQLPEPRPDIEIFDRFAHMNSVTGIFEYPENLKPEPYGYEVINEDGIIGSCTTFKTRKDVTEEIRDEDCTCLCPYKEAVERWGRSLVVVASQALRNLALTGSRILPTFITENLQHYCLLERVARTRWNGLTTGEKLHYSTEPLGLDVKFIFYSVKQFGKHNLAQKQQLKVRYRDRNKTVILLHLTRFYQQLPNQATEIKRSICQYLSRQPSKMQQVSVIKELLNLQNKKHFRNIMCGLQNHVKLGSVGYRQLFPMATKEESSTKNGEKKLYVMVLTKEYQREDDDISDDEENSSTVVGRLWDSGVHSFQYDQTLLHQIYRIIYQAGVEGITFQQLTLDMGISYNIARSAIKCLILTKDVKKLLTAAGTSRTSVYVAQPFWNASSHSFGKALAEFEQKTTELPGKSITSADKVVEVADEENDVLSDGETSGNCQQESKEDQTATNVTMSDVRCTFVSSGIVQPMKNIAGPIRKEYLTEKVVTLANVMLDVLRIRRVFDSFRNLKIAMLDHLVKSGEEIEHQICMKTVKRIADYCVKEGKINQFNIELKLEGKTVMLMLVCAKDVKKNDPLIDSVIQQAKFRHFKLCRVPDNKSAQHKLSGSFDDWSQLAKTAVANQASATSLQAGQKKAKKWEKSKLLHCFLWYILYGHQGSIPVSANEKAKQDNSDGSVRFAEGKEGDVTASSEADWEDLDEPPIYLDVNDFRRYVPPLKKRDDHKTVAGRSEGVCTFGDFLMLLPLSLFAAVTNTQDLSIIQNYLKNQHKKHYPMATLPLDVLGALLNGKKYMTAVTEVCNSLCHLGLMSLGPLIFKDKCKQFIFVRKTALLLDTKFSLSGNVFTNLPPGMTAFPELHFQFDSLDETVNYWNQLQNIALHSNLNRVSVTDKPYPHTVEVHSLKEHMQYKKLDSVVEDYCLPGDRRGAAGLDSRVFIHLIRGWPQDKEISAGPGKKSRPGNKLEKASILSADKEKQGAAKSININQLLSAKTPGLPGHISAQMIQKSSVFRRQNKRNVKRKSKALPRTTLGGLRLPKHPLGRQGTKKKKKKFEKDGEKNYSQESFALDDTDRQCLLNRRSTRVTFSAKENSILVLGKVAMHFLVGTRTSQALNAAIRDVLHERVPKLSLDKTSRSIQSYINRQMRRPKFPLNVLHHLMQLKQDKVLMAKYAQAVIPKMRKIPNEKAMGSTLKALLNDLLNKFTEYQQKNLAMLPETFGSLNQNFRVVLVEKVTNIDTKEWTDVSHDRDACHIALRDFHMSHLLSSGDKQSRNYEMHSTLQQYPESLVDKTFRELTTFSMIAKRKGVSGLEDLSVAGRYALHVRCLQRLHRHNFPADLFTAGSDLLSRLVADCRESQVHRPSTSHKTAGHQDTFLDLTQDLNGHLALCVGLIALDKLSLKIEMGTVIDMETSDRLLPREQLAAKRLSRKRHHSQMNEDSDSHDDDSTSFGLDASLLNQGQRKGHSVKTPKKAKTDKVCAASSLVLDTSEEEISISRSYGSSEAESVVKSGPKSRSPRKQFKRGKRLFSEGNSDQESDSQPADKMARLSSNTNPAGSASERSEQAASTCLVKKDADGLMRLESDSVCIRFSQSEVLRVGSIQERENKVLSKKPSFALVALNRLHPEYMLNPRHHYTANQMFLRPFKIALHMRENQRMQTHSGKPQISTANSSSVTSQPEPQFKSSESLSAKRTSDFPCLMATLDTAVIKASQPLYAQPWYSRSESLFVNTEVFKDIIHQQTKLLPFSMDPAVFWRDIREAMDDKGFSVCQHLYQEIEAGGVFGRMWQDLKAAVSVPCDLLNLCLQHLLDGDVLCILPGQLGQIRLGR